MGVAKPNKILPNAAKTNAAGGEVHKAIIKNKNPIQAPLILNISSSGV